MGDAAMLRRRAGPSSLASSAWSVRSAESDVVHGLWDTTTLTASSEPWLVNVGRGADGSVDSQADMGQQQRPQLLQSDEQRYRLQQQQQLHFEHRLGEPPSAQRFPWATTAQPQRHQPATGAGGGSGVPHAVRLVQAPDAELQLGLQLLADMQRLLFVSKVDVES